MTPSVALITVLLFNSASSLDTAMLDCDLLKTVTDTFARNDTPSTTLPSFNDASGPIAVAIRHRLVVLIVDADIYLDSIREAKHKSKRS